MKFDVPFLKMLSLYMLWRAQFYQNFMPSSDLDLVTTIAKIWHQKVSQKVRIIVLLLVIIKDETPLTKNLNYTRLKNLNILSTKVL